jgi:hypothetical protein
MKFLKRTRPGSILKYGSRKTHIWRGNACKIYLNVNVFMEVYKMWVIGYISFIIITLAACVAAVLLGTYTGIKQGDQNK